jgi:hypothetical protein
VLDDLNVDHLWMTFGKGKDLRWIPIHDIIISLGPRSKACVSFLMGARCYKVGIYSFVADNIFFLSNDVNDEMLLLTCGPLPFICDGYQFMILLDR